MSVRRVLLLSLCIPGLVLTGCSVHPPQSGAPFTGSAQASGSVHGGQQPVAGASIQLYTVGTTADGSAATPLLTSTVTSDSAGSFSITGLYSCTNATQVYIVATGGNPGLSTNNPNIALMAALGACSSLTPSTFININELTTAAAVSALAPYMTSATAIGSSSSNATRLASAFTLANEYVNTTTGFSPGANVPAGDTVPTAELNTLADILSACINSTGGTAGDGSLCGRLFSLATVGSNPAPTNTIDAMLNLADNPTLNTSALFALTPPTPPFQPTLTSAPANFFVGLQSLSPLGVSPSVINFLDVTVGSSSPIQTVTIQNFSSLGNITPVGPNSTDFLVGNFSSSNVGYCASGAAPGQSCFVQVEARPSVAGVRNAFLAIDYNYQTSTLYIPLSVTGVASNTNSILSNSIVNFPPTSTGMNSTPVPVTLANSGPGTITVSAIAINGVANSNFTQTNNCNSVAVNSNCTIYITFAPTATGAQSATLQVTSTASGSNTVSLSGTGLALGTPPALWPSYLSYNIWGANQDLILINSGTTSLSSTNAGVSDTGGASDQHAYSMTANNCGTSLAAGSSCIFVIENRLMVPLSSNQPLLSGVTGVAYAIEGSASLTADILTNNGPVLLQNNAVDGTVTFAASQVGQAQTATIELANVSTTQSSGGQFVNSIGGSPAASLAIGGANPGDFSVSAVTSSVTSAPASFCPGGTSPCNITITFTPTAVGTRTAKISLDANGSSTGQYIYVTGTGQ